MTPPNRYAARSNAELVRLVRETTATELERELASRVEELMLELALVAGTLLTLKGH